MSRISRYDVAYKKKLLAHFINLQSSSHI